MPDPVTGSLRDRVPSLALAGGFVIDRRGKAFDRILNVCQSPRRRRP